MSDTTNTDPERDEDAQDDEADRDSRILGYVLLVHDDSGSQIIGSVDGGGLFGDQEDAAVYADNMIDHELQKDIVAVFDTVDMSDESDAEEAEEEEAEEEEAEEEAEDEEDEDDEDYIAWLREQYVTVRMAAILDATQQAHVHSESFAPAFVVEELLGEISEELDRDDLEDYLHATSVLIPETSRRTPR